MPCCDKEFVAGCSGTFDFQLDIFDLLYKLNEQVCISRVIGFVLTYQSVSFFGANLKFKFPC